MFDLQKSKVFLERVEKLVRRNPSLLQKIENTLLLIQINPMHNSLRTHQVNIPNKGRVWSSRVTGDLRIIWKYDHVRQKVILILAIGGHSGNKKVYK